jgi:hypothetical protein
MEWIKQPNGKYCCVDYYGRKNYANYTEQEIIDLYILNAKRDMEDAKHFGEIIKRIADGNSLRVERVIDDKTLKSMGFDKPYKELMKLIPLKPTNQEYVSCDFAAHGKCPNCGGGVQDGMGHTDEKCRSCGQLLKW